MGKQDGRTDCVQQLADTIHFDLKGARHVLIVRIPRPKNLVDQLIAPQRGHARTRKVDVGPTGLPGAYPPAYPTPVRARLLPIGYEIRGEAPVICLALPRWIND